MKNRDRNKLLLGMLLIVAIYCLIGICSNRFITTFVSNTPIPPMYTVVLDAGHGGEDGGAVSCSGAYESQINLEISLRLRDLMNLMGIPTVLIRDGDYSVYTTGKTLSEKKVSDLKNRVQIVGKLESPLLVSIHQNYFPEGKYAGAQVFYGKTENSQILASKLQSAFVTTLNEGSNRKEKPGDSIYLLKNTKCDAILVECGFLSNTKEDALLRKPEYQKKICCVIAATVSDYSTISPSLS